jgi:hypothetical protein
MNEKDFVNFDIAVKLKNKGFNIPFYFYYRTDDEVKNIHHAIIGKPLTYSDKIDDEVVIAPTLMQVAQWLRDTYQLHIAPYIYTETSRNTHEDWNNWGWCLLNTESGRKIYTDTHQYESYEEGALAGIEYVLNKSDLLISGDKKTKLVKTWFKRIEQLATDRKTYNGYKMTMEETLNEIKVVAKGAFEYLELDDVD